jgi:hypothetical protein
MKALLIREAIQQHFERGGKPLRRMDVGMRGFDDLKRGDVLRCIKEAWVSEKEDLIFYTPENRSFGYYWRVGDFGILKRDAILQDNKLSIELIGMENLDKDIEETAEKIQKNPDFGKIFATVTGIKSPSVWMEFFKVVSPKNLRESLAFDRGGSPLKKLDIGITTWEKLKPGDIIRNIKRVYRASSTDQRLYFSDNEDMTDDDNPGRYFIVKESSKIDDDWSITLYQSGSVFRRAWNISNEVKEGILPNIRTCWSVKPIEAWNEWFKIIQPSEYDEEYETT